MNVIVACEFSGIVRDAFIARGYKAVSCDYLPSERQGPHIQGDVRSFLDEEWDLIFGIALFVMGISSLSVVLAVGGMVMFVLGVAFLVMLYDIRKHPEKWRSAF